MLLHGFYASAKCSNAYPKGSVHHDFCLQKHHPSAKVFLMKPHSDKPHRLSTIFQSYSAPVYFITFCTADRAPLLATNAVHQFAQQALSHGVAIRYYAGSCPLLSPHGTGPDPWNYHAIA
jgi:hypothetical protein